METNLYHLTAEQRHRARDRLAPGDARRGDQRVLRSDLMRTALGDHIFDRYVKLKRQEWDEYRIQLTQWSSTGTCRCFESLEFPSSSVDRRSP